MKLRRRVLGEEHPDTLASMNNLAASLHGLGDLEAACALHEQVFERVSRVLGEEHPDTLTSMSNLASSLHEVGDLTAAKAMNERALAARSTGVGWGASGYVAVHEQPCRVVAARWEISGAHGGCRSRCWRRRRGLLGEEHPDTLTSMSNLAETLGTLGDLRPARAPARQVVAVRRRVLGEAHPDTLTSMNNVAAMLFRAGDAQSARALQQAVLEECRRVLGDEHPETLRSMNNLAQSLRALGDASGAVALLERVLDMLRRTADHPASTAIVQQNLDDARRAAEGQ